MKYISSIKELNAILRNELILQSGIQSSQVRNSLSIHGVDLDKYLQNFEYDSLAQNNMGILFELQTRKSSSDISETEENDNITGYFSYSFYIKIYGNNSQTLANIISSRFNTEAVRDKLFAEGIYIEQISSTNTLQEFVNESMWLRTDFSIEITCRMNIQQVSISHKLEDINQIEIEILKEI